MFVSIHCKKNPFNNFTFDSSGVVEWLATLEYNYMTPTESIYTLPRRSIYSIPPDEG
jgi:hypothetical protein